MIRHNDHKQQQLFDPWSYLGDKRRQMLDQSWPGLFREFILPELPVREFGSFFNTGFGRPTKDLDTVLGVLILKETHDLTDYEAIEQLAFNTQWHYALNITKETDSAKYMCPKTLWNMRMIVAENGLEATLFNTGTEKLAEVFNVDPNKQRIDSVHIQSNMRKLGRITIFSNSIHKFVKNLKRQHSSLFETVEDELVERYLTEKALSCFAMVKPSKSQKTLDQVSTDLYSLIQQFQDNQDVQSMHSFKLLQRILDEQCTVSLSDDGVEISVKEAKQIPSDSLQNPSDPDAGYSGHKGQGYQVQVMETYTDTEDTDQKARTLNLITHVDVESAHESDANALLPAIESTQERDLGPKEVLADSLYGSDENVQTAAIKGVEVVSPPMGSERESTLNLSDFQTGKAGKITKCPQGHAPISTKKKKDRHCAAFDLSHCENCPNREICPAKPGKKASYFRYTDKQLRIALRRSEIQTEEFKDRYRWRAGVEATMSEFDRRTGVKHLRVRSMKAVRYSATLKALGLNILRAAAVMAAMLWNKPDQSRPKRGLFTGIFVFKERIVEALAIIVQLLSCAGLFRTYARKLFF
jgi:hypothetical protein